MSDLLCRFNPELAICQEDPVEPTRPAPPPRPLRPSDDEDEDAEDSTSSSESRSATRASSSSRSVTTSSSSSSSSSSPSRLVTVTRSSSSSASRTASGRSSSMLSSGTAAQASQSSDANQEGGDNTGKVAGIAVGVLLVLVVLAGLVWLFMRKRRQRAEEQRSSWQQDGDIIRAGRLSKISEEVDETPNSYANDNSYRASVIGGAQPQFTNTNAWPVSAPPPPSPNAYDGLAPAPFMAQVAPAAGQQNPLPPIPYSTGQQHDPFATPAAIDYRPTQGHQQQDYGFLQAGGFVDPASQAADLPKSPNGSLNRANTTRQPGSMPYD